MEISFTATALISLYERPSAADDSVKFFHDFTQLQTRKRKKTNFDKGWHLCLSRHKHIDLQLSAQTVKDMGQKRKSGKQ